MLIMGERRSSADPPGNTTSSPHALDGTTEGVKNSCEETKNKAASPQTATCELHGARFSSCERPASNDTQPSSHKSQNFIKHP